jgi:hypothetical protein
VAKHSVYFDTRGEEKLVNEKKSVSICISVAHTPRTDICGHSPEIPERIPPKEGAFHGMRLNRISKRLYLAPYLADFAARFSPRRR